jgi:hypothetical protein
MFLFVFFSGRQSEEGKRVWVASGLFVHRGCELVAAIGSTLGLVPVSLFGVCRLRAADGQVGNSTLDKDGILFRRPGSISTRAERIEYRRPVVVLIKCPPSHHARSGTVPLELVGTLAWTNSIMYLNVSGLSREMGRNLFFFLLVPIPLHSTGAFVLSVHAIDRCRFHFAQLCRKRDGEEAPGAKRGRIPHITVATPPSLPIDRSKWPGRGSLEAGSGQEGLHPARSPV